MSEVLSFETQGNAMKTVTTTDMKTVPYITQHVSDLSVDTLILCLLYVVQRGGGGGGGRDINALHICKRFEKCVCSIWLYVSDRSSYYLDIGKVALL